VVAPDVGGCRGCGSGGGGGGEQGEGEGDGGEEERGARVQGWWVGGGGYKVGAGWWEGLVAKCRGCLQKGNFLFFA
jgi:hypothetical protein